MNIGILTYYRVANFGANLQAVSTYYYLVRNGHNPIFILYESKETIEKGQNNLANAPQKNEHINFIDSIISKQTFHCSNAEDINRAIKKYQLDGIIIGSDAVLQHHPLRTRIKKGKCRPFYIYKVVPERLFPNCYWGCGITKEIPIAMMSVSSQNSAYKYFGKKLNKKMAEVLEQMKYISVRDNWTQEMIKSITNKKLIPPITPDPVFAFNLNAGHLVPTEKVLKEKYRLPEKYALISLFHQDLTIQQMNELKSELESYGIACVAFPMPTGLNFQHPFEYSINTPLPVIDWYGLIKYASAYIGSNMHPIIVSLHNATPCYSIDFWGTTDFWGNYKEDGSSKVSHILKVFNLEKNRTPIEKGKCDLDIKAVVNSIINFPKTEVSKQAKQMVISYDNMMQQILSCLTLK